MIEELTESEVMEMVREKIKKEFNGSLNDYAEYCNITPQYLFDVLSRRRYLGKAILASLGLKMIVCYRKLE